MAVSRPASGEFWARPDCWRSGRVSPPRRARLRAAAPSAPALAHRRFLHQPQRHVLLPVQRVGRLQPGDRPWDLRESMTEAEIEIILQGPKRIPEAKPRSSPITDRSSSRGISRSSSGFGMTHVRTSPLSRNRMGGSRGADADRLKEKLHPAGKRRLNENQDSAETRSRSTWSTTTPCAFTAPLRFCHAGGTRRRAPGRDRCVTGCAIGSSTRATEGAQAAARPAA